MTQIPKTGELIDQDIDGSFWFNGWNLTPQDIDWEHLNIEIPPILLQKIKSSVSFIDLQTDDLIETFIIELEEQYGRWKDYGGLFNCELKKERKKGKQTFKMTYMHLEIEYE